MLNGLICNFTLGCPTPAGITDEQITRAMIEKLKVNKSNWPDPEDGEPRSYSHTGGIDFVKAKSMLDCFPPSKNMDQLTANISIKENCFQDGLC